MLRLGLALFLVQSGFHGFTAALPVALHRAGLADAEIGVLMGIAAVVQIGAAFVGGVLVDRFGGVRLVVVAAGAYMLASLSIMLGGPPGASVWPVVLARAGQGVGVALALPACLSLVPRLVSPARIGLGLAFTASAHNVTMVVLPPISLAILSAAGLQMVAAVIVAAIVGGLVVLLLLPIPPPVLRAPGDDGGRPAARRRFGLAFRRAWLLPLVALVLFTIHWGMLLSYLPQRAEAAGANIGLFFAADGVAILLIRLVAGGLMDRMAARPIMLAGIVLTLGANAVLWPDPTTPLLVLAGALTGGGAGLVVTGLLVELSRRADDADRGSAFSIYSAALAVAIVIGSIGLAPLIATLGFRAALGVGIGCVLAAAALMFMDTGLAQPRATEPAQRSGQPGESADPGRGPGSACETA